MAGVESMKHGLLELDISGSTIGNESRAQSSHHLYYKLKRAAAINTVLFLLLQSRGSALSPVPSSRVARACAGGELARLMSALSLFYKFS